MKFILIVLSLAFFNTPAFAEPKDLTGLWHFNGQVQGSFKIETGRLAVRTDRDRVRLAELKSQGFECVYTHSQVYRCKKISDLTEVLASHLNQIQPLYEGHYFEMMKPTGGPSIITEGDVAIQWSVPSVVNSEKGKTPVFEYWELSGVDKIKIQIDGEIFWLNLVDQNSIAELYLIRENVGTIESQYFYQVLFQR